MEGKKQVGSSSSSSFTNDLFGSKDSSASSEIIGAIFSPSSKAVEKQVSESNKNPGNESFKNKSAFGLAANDKETGKQSGEVGSIYQEQHMQQPCNLSSSIYYGGQDIYYPPQSTNTTIKKDVREDDLGSASRGNWWQGSLYY